MINVPDLQVSDCCFEVLNPCGFSKVQKTSQCPSVSPKADNDINLPQNVYKNKLKVILADIKKLFR